MKLIYVLSEDWFFCSHFIQRAIAAKAAGYDVAVLTHLGTHATFIRAKGIRVISLKLDRRSTNLFKELGVIAQIFKVYKKEKPDLVHHVALKPVLYGSVAAKLAGIRSVVNAPVGMGYVFISQSLKAKLLKSFVSSGLKRLLNPPGSRVIFENRDDASALIASGYVRSEDSVLIRGAGVDISLFRPTPEPSTVPTVILTARMLWDKGVGEFVEASRMLKARGLECRMLLVGAPDPLNRAAVDERVLLGWQAEGIVEWLGFRTDIALLLADSHIVCLPSYREGLPKALLEAMACGKPIVTTDVPGCREAVTHGLNGLLVPPRNSGALAEALAELIASPEKRRSMGQAGRHRAEKEFSDARVIAETLGVYRAISTH